MVLAFVTDDPDPFPSALSDLGARAEKAGSLERISQLLKEEKPLLVLGSSLERPAAEAIGASLLEAFFPSRRINLARTYCGVQGAVTLAEDFALSALEAREARDAALALRLSRL